MVNKRKTKNLTALRDVGNVDEVYLPEETFGFCLKCNGKKTDWKEDYLADGYCVECWDSGLSPYDKRKKVLTPEPEQPVRVNKLDVDDIMNWVKSSKKPVVKKGKVQA